MKEKGRESEERLAQACARPPHLKNNRTKSRVKSDSTRSESRATPTQVSYLIINLQSTDLKSIINLHRVQIFNKSMNAETQQSTDSDSDA